MEISIEEDQPYLVYQGQSISLEARDLRMLKVMTPPGRKVYLRQKAKRMLRESPSDCGAAWMVTLFSLPARTWSFAVPS